MLTDVFLVGGVRTAIGSFLGAFSEMGAPALGSSVVIASLKSAQIPPEKVDEVIFGNVLSAGLGQNMARQVSIGAGLSSMVGATTVNKVCGSGLKAVMLAAQSIQCGDAGVVIAGGSENMSRAPYLLEKARLGYRKANGELVDSMIKDGLWDVYNNIPMGVSGDNCALKYSFSRIEQDNFAVESYRRALIAMENGTFKDEIIPVEVLLDRKTLTVAEDEEPLRFKEEKLRQLPPAFGKNGTVTAGNASSINDGAASIIALSGEKVETLELEPQAKILGYSTVSRDPEWFPLAPIDAISKLMNRLCLTLDDIDLFEINEAFSCVPMAAMVELGIPHGRLNVHGGAIALGHPIGASGVRTLVTLLNSMRCRKAKIGINALCIGGGEAVAMAVELC